MASYTDAVFFIDQDRTLAQKVVDYAREVLGFPTKVIKYDKFFHTLTTNVHVSITESGQLEQRGIRA